MQRCEFCKKRIKEDIGYCPNCGHRTRNEQTKEETKEDQGIIQIPQDKVHITKAGGGGNTVYEQSYGDGSFRVRTSSRKGGGLFGGLFGDIFHDEETEEEYTDFTDIDERFINPNVRIIDETKMVVISQDDLKKDNDKLKD